MQIINFFRKNKRAFKHACECMLTSLYLYYIFKIKLLIFSSQEKKKKIAAIYKLVRWYTQNTQKMSASMF